MTPSTTTTNTIRHLTVVDTTLPSPTAAPSLPPTKPVTQSDPLVPTKASTTIAPNTLHIPNLLLMLMKLLMQSTVATLAPSLGQLLPASTPPQDPDTEDPGMINPVLIMAAGLILSIPDQNMDLGMVGSRNTRHPGRNMDPGMVGGRRNLNMGPGMVGESRNLNMGPNTVPGMVGERRNLNMVPGMVGGSRNLNMDPGMVGERKNLNMDPGMAGERKNLNMDPGMVVVSRNLNMGLDMDESRMMRHPDPGMEVGMVAGMRRRIPGMVGGRPAMERNRVVGMGMEEGVSMRRNQAMEGVTMRARKGLSMDALRKRGTASQAMEGVMMMMKRAMDVRNMEMMALMTMRGGRSITTSITIARVMMMSDQIAFACCMNGCHPIVTY